MKDNDFESIKNIAKILIYIEPEESKMGDIVLYHPFFNTRYMYNHKINRLLDMFNSDDFELLARDLESRIDELNNIEDIYYLFILFNKPYRGFFFKQINSYLDDKYFGELLRETWVDLENPNDDANVSLKQWIRFFKKADKNYLIDKEDTNKYLDILDKSKTGIDVYRGVSKSRVKYGLSWTDDFETAEWFSNRFGDGYILKSKCYTKNILAYFNIRGENEIVIDVFDKDFKSSITII